MFVEIKPPGWYPFHHDEDEIIRYQLGSVALWVIVDDKYFLAVQQADKDGLPWGIPGGHVAKIDDNFKDVARRELGEETGIQLRKDELNYLTFIYSRQAPEKGHLLFLAHISLNSIFMNNPRQDKDGTIRFDPPPGVDTKEIAQLALIPLSRAFEDNLLNRNPYHSKYTYHGYTALRSRSIVKGSFPFENDPGL